jgi:hypothetical protein
VCVRTERKQQVPPLRSPGFPVELGGVGAPHAPFPNRKAHTRPRPVQRDRKSGYAPVGMTIRLCNWLVPPRLTAFFGYEVVRKP